MIDKIIPVKASVFIVLLFFALPSISLQRINQQVRIDEEQFVQINGIEQWVTIHGDSSKPIILFLHGGPGSPISPYSRTLYKEWENDYLLVQWDQRGTGKTFGRTAPDELTPDYLKSNPLTVGQMVDDGIALTEYLIQKLKKTKVILFGTSWGSVLGVKMSIKHPDLFYAYVGHSQITMPDNDIALYDKVYQRALNYDDTAALNILNKLGHPPYQQARNTGKLLQVIKKYEQKNSMPPPANWFVPDSAYNNPKDEQNRSDGDDYSFVNYVGDEKLGVLPMRKSINILRDEFEFKIPVYLIQGNEDILTSKIETSKYLGRIKAPYKKYFLTENTAHGFNQSVLEIQFKIFREIKIE